VAHRIRVAVLVITLMLGFIAYQRLAGLDARFLAFSSLSGVEGLIAYLLGDYAWAAEAYRRHLVKVIGDAEHELPLGTRALLVGDLDAARREASEALRVRGVERHARLTLGEVALARGQNREAVAEFDSLLATDVDQFDALLLKAVAQARLRLDGDAITSLNRALRHPRVETRPTAFLSALAITGELGFQPLHKRLACLLATLHRYLRIYDPAQSSTAVRYAEQAIAAGDHPADANVTAGVVHLKRGRRARALAAFQAAIAADPTHAMALVQAAHLHGERGDLSEEDQLMTAAFAAAPNDAWIAQTFNVHLTRLGDYQRAVDLNLRRTATVPEDIKAWWRLGALYLDLGEPEHALAATDKGLAHRPRDLALHENRAIALASMDRADAAFTEYRYILTLDPANRRAYYGIALLHRTARRYQDARQAFEALLALGESDLDAHNGYCEILLLLREAAAGEACATRVLRHAPDNIAAQANLGVARRMRGGRP
jgi:tetratricopeptide (TPR) repeat protein